MAERWEVFGKRTGQDPWTAVGAVHAPDREMALLLAKESFFRHGEGVDFAVVRRDHFHRFGDADLMGFATDKTYKLQTGYTGLGRKRREAAAAAAASGTAITSPRPEDLREPKP